MTRSERIKETLYLVVIGGAASAWINSAASDAPLRRTALTAVALALFFCWGRGLEAQREQDRKKSDG